MKKHYYTPSIKVAKVELQGLIAASAQITPPISDKPTDDDAKMSNQVDKNWSHTWKQRNLKQAFERLFKRLLLVLLVSGKVFEK